jgi:hypothetical protein
MAQNMLIRWVPLLLLATVLAACAGRTNARVSPTQDEANPSGPTSTGPQAPADPADRLEIRVGEARIVATLRDTAAAQDLRAQLPARLTMRDHGGVEKTGRLSGPLTVTDEPAGADPDVGDLGYYAPGQDLVLYYGDQSYFVSPWLSPRAVVARLLAPRDISTRGPNPARHHRWSRAVHCSHAGTRTAKLQLTARCLAAVRSLQVGVTVAVRSSPRSGAAMRCVDD